MIRENLLITEIDLSSLEEVVGGGVTFPISALLEILQATAHIKTVLLIQEETSMSAVSI